MTDRMDTAHRVRFALGGVALVAMASACVLAGFALSAVWPGLSWSLGSALGLVLLLPAVRWLRAAITGRVPRPPRDTERRGTI
jgi:hypothetical protein